MRLMYQPAENSRLRAYGIFAIELHEQLTRMATQHYCRGAPRERVACEPVLQGFQKHTPIPLRNHDAESSDCVVAPCCWSNSRYHVSAWAARPGNAVVPQISESVFLVDSPVFVRWVSFTALPHGPRASNKHNKPPKSIVCPDGLNT